MDVLLELLFEVLGETVLQVLGELISEWGVRRVRGRGAAPPARPLLALLGYALLGLLAGGLSLWLLPDSLLPTRGLRLANLLLSPLLSGSVLAAIGHWRARHGALEPVRNRFMQGLVFAFAMAALRYLATL